MRVIIVMDKSGSMASIWDDAIGMCNSYIDTIKEEAAKNKLPEPLVTLTLFDTEVVEAYRDVPVGSVEHRNRVNYMPSGMTALHDAIGRTLVNYNPPDPDKERVLCVIITDGQENSSEEYSRDGVKALIGEREAVRDSAGEGVWTFVFLGANQDAWAGANAIGVSSGNVVAYDSTQKGIENLNTFSSLRVREYMVSGGRGTSCFTGKSMGVDLRADGDLDLQDVPPLGQPTIPAIKMPKYVPGPEAAGRNPREKLESWLKKS